MDENKRALLVCARSADRTLGENEVNQAFEKIVEEINQNTPYSLRT